MSIRQGSTFIAGRGGALPSQSGQNGKFLTTDGTSASWADVDISSKLDKVTSTTDYQQVYVKGQNGSQSMVNLTSGILASGIVQRTPYGQIDLPTPTSDSHATNKKYVDEAIDSTLPSQTGQNGKFLNTDGTDASWGVPKTFNLLDFKWTDHELNDQNWLRSDTFSWQDGTVYSEAYQHLVADITGKTLQSETISGYTVHYYLADDGHKIVPDTYISEVENLYNNTGVAWYYVIDLVNQQFKLPRTKYNKFVQNQILPIRGNGMTLGITQGESKTGGLSQFSGLGLVAAPNKEGLPIGTSDNSNGFNNGKLIGVITDPTKSGVEAIYSSTDDSNMHLYFYVGQFSQTATEQTAGLNAELFNNKLDLDAANLSTQGKSLISGLGMPSNRYIDLTLGASGSEYTAPANGWIKITQRMSGYHYMNIYVAEDGGASFQAPYINSTDTIAFVLPIRKNQKFVVQYEGTLVSVDYNKFQFVYAEGEK